MPDGGKRTDINPGVLTRIVQGARYIISGASSAWMGPLQALQPMAPADVKGRRFDYPVGYNLDTRSRGYEPVTFEQLRSLAENCDLLRLVIEKRKDQMEALPWCIRPKRIIGDKKEVKVSPAQRRRIDAITGFLESPDGEIGFPEWQRQILEDKFVIDQVAIYKRRARGGKLYALELLDAGTIRPLINADGRRPEPPEPAYQQILKSIPAVDFTSDELAVILHNPRSWKLYGKSETEQVLITVNIAIRRALSQLDYYTAGSQPDAFLGMPTNWTMEQIKGFQEWFDSLLSGHSANRRRLRMVPGDMKYQETKLPPQKDVWDEWLARIICFAFSIPPEPFIQQHSRAGAESSKDRAAEEGLAPLQLWFAGIINRLVLPEFGSPDLEFAYLDDRETDPQVAAQIDASDTGSGILTIDEVREARGLEPLGGAAATAMVKTPGGYVPLDSYEQQQEQRQQPLPGAAQDRPNGTPAEGKPAKGKDLPEAQKAAYGRLRKAVRHSPLPFPNPTSEKAVARLTGRLTDILKQAGEESARQAKAALKRLGKAADDDEDTAAAKPESAADAAIAADEAAMAITLDALNDVPGAAEDQLLAVAQHSGGGALAQLGTDTNDGIVGVVNDAAVDYARYRSGEMIGKVFNDEGELVDNPDAAMVITDTTRDMIRNIIARGLQDGIGRQEIADNIQSSAAFSADRASIIARTEIARANSAAALEAYQASEAAGLKIMKEWYPAPDCCPLCQANADMGPIPLEGDFDSGDDAPPGHPACQCVLLPIAENPD